MDSFHIKCIAYTMYVSASCLSKVFQNEKVLVESFVYACAMIIIEIERLCLL